MHHYHSPGASSDSRFSVRSKLVFAFGAIAALFSLAMVASESGFDALEDNLVELETFTVPIAIATQELAIQVRSLELLGLNVDELQGVDQVAARRALFREALENTRKVGEGLGDEAGQFQVVLAELGVSVDGALDLRAKQLGEASMLNESLRTASSEATALVEDLETEVIEAKARGEVGLDLGELRVAIYSCGNLISQVGNASDPDVLAKIENGFRLEARRATELLVRIQAMDRQRFGAQLGPMVEHTTGLAGVFRRKAAIHALGVQLEDADRAGAELMDNLRTLALEAATSGRRDVSAAREVSNQRAGRAKFTVRALFAVAVLFSIAIIVLYVHRGVGRRLTELTDDLHRLSEGDHDIEVRRGGDAELARLADAAEIFRRNAIELVAASEDLERKNTSLLEFAHVASHDLKSPMRAISNLASWVIEDCADQLPEASRGHLTLIQERSIRMESLLEDLLRFSRMGNDERIQEVVSVRGVVEEVVDLLGLPDSANLAVHGGDQLIETITAPLKLTIRNLLQNSLVHHDKEKQALSVHVSPITDGWLEIVFEDDGPGIPSNKRTEVFQIFRKLTAASEGTGMGLALVKRAVETMGGTIETTLKDGRGARFVVRWPAAEPELSQVGGTGVTTIQRG